MHMGKTLVALIFAATPMATTAQPADPPPIAPLLEGIGPLHFPISTVETKVQRYFNQALTLAFGFNHAEAVRSFRAAAALDPTCGICFAGAALALGPNINAPMSEEAIAPAWKAVEFARAQRHHETDRERDYIDAIVVRYSEDGEDRAALDAAFSEAMGALAAKYPDDLHALTLYAESLMEVQRQGPPNRATETGNRAHANGGPSRVSRTFIRLPVAQLDEPQEKARELSALANGRHGIRRGGTATEHGNRGARGHRRADYCGVGGNVREGWQTDAAV